MSTPTDQNGDARLIEEVSAEVVKLFDGNANYAYGSNERVELYKSIVNLIISAREKAVREAQMKMFNRLFHKTEGVDNPQQGAQLIIHELNIIRAELTDDKEALATLRSADMADLTVQLQEMFYMALGDTAESEQVQELTGTLHTFITDRLADR